MMLMMVMIIIITIIELHHFEQLLFSFIGLVIAFGLFGLIINIISLLCCLSCSSEGKSFSFYFSLLLLSPVLLFYLTTMQLHLDRDYSEAMSINFSH